MENNYDSTQSTLEHIRRVQSIMTEVIGVLAKRAIEHDQSKLLPPEKELFDKYTPILDSLEYDSKEYGESLENLKVALDHHYSKNSHHPQFYPNGIDGMSLFDVIEMFVDWVAATERTKGGRIYTSIEINKERFQISEQLKNIFNNTAKIMDL